MKKSVEKRRSLAVGCFRDPTKMDLPTPSRGPQRKASLFHNFVSPVKPSTRRYSLSSLVLGSSTTSARCSFDRSSSPPNDSEADFLSGHSIFSEEFVNTQCPFLKDSSPVFRTGEEVSLLTRRRSVTTSCMGRAMRVIVAGSKKVGKTSILRQVACMEDITTQPYCPTLDDTYQVLLEEGDRPRENLVFHDTGGIADYGPAELKKAYLQVADAFVLVYSVVDHESFNRVDLLKKFIEKQFGKEKKEVPIVVLGNMRDLPGRQVDREFAQTWATREKVKLFEVTATDRSSLVDFVQYLGMRHFHPSKESKFSLSKKLKSDKSNAAIVMDF
ncbi:unnamed protein product [Auanema sp. JU1783]|nr:unnamed protein product [Auanema sp. JU1783]